MPLMTVDGAAIETSNWLRWLNCPRNRREENVKGVYCYGKMMYVVTKPIYPSQELLVYYGDGYAQNLGIDIREFATPGEGGVDEGETAPCQQQCQCPCG